MKKLVKGLVVLAMTVGVVSPALAVEERDPCEDNYIIFNAGLKNKDYAHAYKYWHLLVGGDCEALLKEKKTVFTNGTFVIKKLHKDAADKSKLEDSLFWAYDQHLSIIGEDMKIVEKYGVDYAKYRKKDAQKAYDLLFKSTTALGNDTKSKAAIQYLYRAEGYLFKEQKFTKAQMVEEYVRLSAICAFKIKNAKNEKDAAGWQKVQDYLDKAAAPFMTCEILTEVYTPKVDAEPTNAELLKKVLDYLNRKDCTGDFYEKVVEYLHKVDPSAASAFGLSKIKDKSGKKSESQTYLDEAIKLEEDLAKKIDYVKWGVQKISQGKYLPMWKELDPNDGEPYLLEARKYAGMVNNKSVGESVALRKLVYSLAIDYCEKAKSVDSGIASRANKLIENYKGNLPECSELFQYGVKKGESYKIPSIGKTTTVRCN